jgi:uncharacterized membrane protein YdfJ with MMPL/SSD domain
VLASGTSGKSVVFAGVTVLLAISGMFLVVTTDLLQHGDRAVTVVTIAVIIAVTLLPAILAILGDNVNRWRPGSSVVGTPKPVASGGGSATAFAHPVAITVVTVVCCWRWRFRHHIQPGVQRQQGASLTPSMPRRPSPRPRPTSRSD